VRDAAELLPPLSRIDTALRAATAVLSSELRTPTDHAPAWDRFEWAVAAAAATMQGIAPLLAHGSRWSDRPSWQQFLGEQRQHVAVRQDRIETLLRLIDFKAQAQGVPLVPLKGAALHALRIYEPGDRPMADIDLFVLDSGKHAASRALLDCGFEVTFENWRHQLFERHAAGHASAEFGEHADNPIKIELHTTIRERLPLVETDITEFIAPVHSHPGLNEYRSRGTLMMHLLLHAASNMRVRALRLIQLHDIARLGARISTADWEELLSARPSGRGLWWAAPPLLLAARECGAEIPAFVLAAVENDCSYLLRTATRRLSLADVSWSNIRVHAFPGIEWSRSVGEALRLMGTRLWPSAETRAELAHFVEHEQGKSPIAWYGIPQWQRVLRWLVSRPPRVQTLRIVLAALERRA
jgi:Uncharacterised nucleotidyltransferase